jgi:hypothetical protein
VDPTPSPPTGWGESGTGSSYGGQIAGFFCDPVQDQLFNNEKSSVSQGISSTQITVHPREGGDPGFGLAAGL